MCVCGVCVHVCVCVRVCECVCVCDMYILAGSLVSLQDGFIYKVQSVNILLTDIAPLSDEYIL